MMRSTNPGIDTHFIILNWNGWADTIACIQSLEAQDFGGITIIVVDNGSTDDSVRILREQFPGISVLENQKNLGFAGGMNVGIRYALSVGAERLFLLNNDTIAEKSMMRNLIAELHGDVGIAAPAIFFEKDPDTLWSLGGKIHPLFLEMLIPHGGQAVLPTAPIDRDFVTGCAMLVHAEIFRTVGLFDEGFYPAYYEDLDFCLRVRQNRKRIVVVPTARLLHKVSRASGGEGSPPVFYLMAKNSSYYFRKHMKFWQMPFILTYRFLSAVKTTVKLIVRGQWKALSAYWSGLTEGWLGVRKKTNNPYTAFYENR